MHWRIPFALVLSLLVAMSCQDAPTAAEDSVAEAPEILFDSHGNNGAVRWIPDPFCAVFDGDGEPVFVDCRNQIATFSRNGNAIVVVHETGVSNTTGKVVKWDAWNPPQVLLDAYELEAPPAPCFALGTEGEALFTMKWQAMVTPGGHASLICHYAEKWEYQWPD